jgi:hypothetical protein
MTAICVLIVVLGVPAAAWTLHCSRRLDAQASHERGSR